MSGMSSSDCTKVIYYFAVQMCIKMVRVFSVGFSVTPTLVLAQLTISSSSDRVSSSIDSGNDCRSVLSNAALARSFCTSSSTLWEVVVVAGVSPCPLFMKKRKSILKHLI